LGSVRFVSTPNRASNSVKDVCSSALVWLSGKIPSGSYVRVDDRTWANPSSAVIPMTLPKSNDRRPTRVLRQAGDHARLGWKRVVVRAGAAAMQEHAPEEEQDRSERPEAASHHSQQRNQEPTNRHRNPRGDQPPLAGFQVQRIVHGDGILSTLRRRLSRAGGCDAAMPPRARSLGVGEGYCAPQNRVCDPLNIRLDCRCDDAVPASRPRAPVSSAPRP
jgi:hypothetical protein